jgi:hypothetical protein
MTDIEEISAWKTQDAHLLELQGDLAYLKLLIADLRLYLRLKAGYDPNQPRGDHGRWVDTGGGTRFAQADMPDRSHVDLLDEEQRGGHTISKHVGATPGTLTGYVRDSILMDPSPDRHDIRSGSFPSLEAADKLVNATLDRNRDTVDGVRSGILDKQRVDAYFGSPTGIEAYASTIRSQPRIRETYGVGVYIRRDPSAKNGFRVITAYPRNRD